ncbi:hypothetical protein BDN70DRAFT_583868 [Pholiota conissans]|uniref:Uncharacterized protein n=1 Tax=Pholiota conissans TaxID=109636 RepID=A0A9P5YLE4_9AGAR|nr:hypothetical protein BDN70DRAFT_583868 [Pholiota conissans]
MDVRMSCWRRMVEVYDRRARQIRSIQCKPHQMRSSRPRLPSRGPQVAPSLRKHHPPSNSHQIASSSPLLCTSPRSHCPGSQHHLPFNAIPTLTFHRHMHFVSLPLYAVDSSRRLIPTNTYSTTATADTHPLGNFASVILLSLSAHSSQSLSPSLLSMSSFSPLFTRQTYYSSVHTHTHASRQLPSFSLIY